jgi:START domain
MISFTSTETENMRPIASSHVRASLFVSMYLVRDMGDDKCHMTRLLSFDLAGNIGQKLSNAVMTQQANMPVVIFDYLKKHEPAPFERRFRSAELLSNEDVRRNVVERSEHTNEEASVSHSTTNNTSKTDNISNGVSLHRIEYDEIRRTGIGAQAIMLFAPIAIHRLAVLSTWDDIAIPLFLITAFLAIRQIVRWQIGGVLDSSASNGPTVPGSIKFRFAVDLKGILRFIANKKEEREEINSESADVSVVHIVAAAVARVLKKEHELKGKRLTIPCLFIDEVVDASSDPVNVSILENSAKSSQIVTVNAADRLDAQTIATELSRVSTERDHNTSNHNLGHCLIIASPANVHDESDIVVSDVIPFAGSGIAVVAVLGEIRIDRRGRTSKSQNGGPYTPQMAQPRPVLSLSLLFSPCGASDVVNITQCRRFADEVQKLLQFPEMCDG